MFFLRRPDDAAVARLLAEQAGAPFSYAEVGATRDADDAPPGYFANRGRARLGAGEAAFRRAVEALRRWAQYDMEWVEVAPPGASLEPGTVVGVLVRHYGFWSLNPCRVVYAIDEETAEGRRFGFGYGTLPAHGEAGEERFTVTWRAADDAVEYELFSFSRPGHPGPPLARLGLPLARPLQRRFARESPRAMRRAVAGG